jgi:hypothetical protein
LLKHPDKQKPTSSKWNFMGKMQETEGNPCGALGNTPALEVAGAQWDVGSDRER